MKESRKIRGAWILAVAALAGCFAVPPVGNRDAWDEHPLVTFPRRCDEDAAAAGPRPETIVPAAADFDAFLALPESEMDPGLGALLFARRIWPDLPIEPYLLMLDAMAREISARSRGAKGADLIDHINQYLYFELGFKYDPKDPRGILADNLYLHRVMRRRKGYCVSLGVLYLALGKRLGLPLYGVRIPSHFIVRYDDGRTQRNIETTDFGMEHPDAYYVGKYRISQASLNRGIYLRNVGCSGAFVDMFNNEGTLLGMKGDLEAALDSLSRAGAIDPSAPYIHYNRGVIRLRMDMEDEALEDFEKALDLDPNNFYAMNNLAEIYANRGQFEKALAETNRALTIQPSYSNGYLSRAMILFKMGSEDTARRNVDRAIELDGSNAMAYIVRARLSREKNDFKRAVWDLNRAVGADPLEPRAWAERGFTNLAMDRLDRAVEDFDKAVELAPGVMEYRLNRGVARLKNRDSAGAREDFDEAARLAPGHPEPLLKRAALAYIEKRYSEAVADLDEVLAARPGNSTALLRRGAALLALGRTGEARADLLASEAASPSTAETHKHLARIFAKEGDRSGAKEQYSKFVECEGGEDPDGRKEAVEYLKR